MDRHDRPDVSAVVARQCGPEGKSWSMPAADAADAQPIANRLMATDERHREMTDATAASDPADYQWLRRK